NPDRFQKFFQRRFLHFFVFLTAWGGGFFGFPRRDLAFHCVVEFLLADCGDFVRKILDLRYVTGGDARRSEALGDREAEEEQDENGTEKDQRQALAPGRSVLSRFASLPSFRSHAGGSIVKLPRLSRLKPPKPPRARRRGVPLAAPRRAPGPLPSAPPGLPQPL